jgi:hypothetical protein
MQGPAFGPALAGGRQEFCPSMGGHERKNAAAGNRQVARQLLSP